MKTTPLHDIHKASGAKMGEFAGYDMPLYYGDGVIKEHEWTRAHAGLFDVSHMGQIVVEGPNVASFWEKMTPSSFANARDNAAKYTVLTNEKGGIIDDLIVTRLTAERFYAVLNAGCKDKDIAWLRAHLPPSLTFHYLENKALIALQGPAAETALREALGIDARGLGYMKAHLVDDCTLVSRLGYTGEDGFELSVPADAVSTVWQKLAAHPEVKPVGLAARDSLRLEMGYCLYGHDIDETTTPLEAGLRWVMGKDNTGFTGAAAALQPPARRRVGIRLLDKGIAREGAVLLDGDGNPIGTMTSGGFSPTLKQSIGQGYVAAHHAAPGTKVQADVRGRLIPAEIARLPFVDAKTKTD